MFRFLARWSVQILLHTMFALVSLSFSGTRNFKYVWLDLYN
jgi:hypothetical protein